jgi:uncharacterized protein YijF (DUF1287 family)
MYTTPRRKALWRSLQRGDIMTFSREGVQCHHGIVEDYTDDGLIVWVIDDIGHRRLFHVEDDYSFTVSGNVYY